MAKMDENKPILQYGKQRKRLRLWRWAALLGLILVAGKYSTNAVDKLTLIWFETRCMDYADSTGVPVYAWVIGDTENAPQYSTMRLLENASSCNRQGRIVTEWDFVRNRTMRLWRFAPEATVFVGKLRSTTGTERLVGIQASNDYAYQATRALGGAPGFSIGLEIGSYTPSSLLTSTKYQFRIASTELGNLVLETLDRARVGIMTIYAGNVDLRDSSRFRAKVVIGDKEGALVGILRDDGTIDVSLEGFDDLLNGRKGVWE